MHEPNKWKTTDMPMRQAGNGGELPAIGLGTLELRGYAGVAAVGTAIDLGYRLLDTAPIYDNEGAVGRAVRDAAVPRDALLLSTKLPGRAHRHDLALEFIEESLLRTGLDHLDLVLIHWPNPRIGRYAEAWRALIEARDHGLTRLIGVSNFLPEHLDRLIEETGETPTVNQIEAHPYFPQHAAVAANTERGILTEAWSPLGRGTDLLLNPVVLQIAGELQASAAQAVLAWSIRRGLIPLPKAPTPDWQAENLTSLHLDITEEQTARLNSLARHDGRVSNQDPRTHEEF